MRKNLKGSLILALTALVLASLACQSVGGGEPSTSTEEVPSEPIAEIPTFAVDSDPTEEEASSTGGAYDGDWTGTNTVDDKEILFTVENNQVTSVSLNYTGEASGCTYHGAASLSVDAGTIEGDSFTVVEKPINDELTFTGTFSSDSEASGTLHIKSSADGLCGEYEKEISWTATKGSSTSAEPTEDTSGTVSEEDSNAIVTQFFDAINAGDMDAAMDMTGENVMFNFGATNAEFGRDALKAYLTSSGLTYQVSDIESFGGGMAQFKATASDGTSYSFCTILLQDGKIISLSLQP